MEVLIDTDWCFMHILTKTSYIGLEIKFGYVYISIEKLLLIGIDQGQIIIWKLICKKNKEN
jgi:hypothetical protein